MFTHPRSISNRVIGRAVRLLPRLRVGDPISRTLDAVLAIPGQITRSEAAQLLELAGRVEHDRDIVEIGSYRGRSSAALAYGARRGGGARVYAVDPHTEFDGVCGGQFGPADQVALYRALANKRTRIGETVAVVSLPSERAARAWTENTIGLLWIDGDHREKGVRSDVRAWFPHVVDGGVIAFHDSSTRGVRRVIDENVATGVLIPRGDVNELSWFVKGI